MTIKKDLADHLWKHIFCVISCHYCLVEVKLSFGLIKVLCGFPLDSHLPVPVHHQKKKAITVANHRLSRLGHCGLMIQRCCQTFFAELKNSLSLKFTFTGIWDIQALKTLTLILGTNRAFAVGHFYSRLLQKITLLFLTNNFKLYQLTMRYRIHVYAQIYM